MSVLPVVIIKLETLIVESFGISFLFSNFKDYFYVISLGVIVSLIYIYLKKKSENRAKIIARVFFILYYLIFLVFLILIIQFQFRAPLLS